MTTDMAEEDFIEALNDECIRLRQEIQALQKCCNEFKSRTCENCKYYKYSNDIGSNMCLNFESAAKLPEPDFGCNKWKEKD